MKTNIRNPAPFLITISVLALVCGLYLIGEATKNRPEGEPKLDVFDHVECITYDARVRMAASFSEMTPISTNLATLFIDDKAVYMLNRGDYIPFLAPAWDGNVSGLRLSLPLPRFVYAQLIREAKVEGAIAIGFDVLFPEVSPRSPDHAVKIDDTVSITSDEFFAQEIQSASNVVLATEGQIVPHVQFLRRAAAIGDISTRRDYGVLRRVKAFNEYKTWHPEIQDRIEGLNLVLDETFRTNVFMTNEVVTAGVTNTTIEQVAVLRFPRSRTPQEVVDNVDPEPFDVRVNARGELLFAKDGSVKMSSDPIEDGDTSEPPFVMRRAWNLGLTMAAMHLGLDLQNAKIESRKITLTGPNGLTRVIPVDEENRFFIDWSIRWSDISKKKVPVYAASPLELLTYDGARVQFGGETTNLLANKLVLIGSVGTGNNISDIGVTPLEANTFLVTKHLNVANSILLDRFVKTASRGATLAWIIGFGILAAILTWRANVVHASIRIAIVALLYILGAFVVYVTHRYWLPIVMPVFGGLLLPHFSLVTYRVVFEQKEQRHLKSVFQKVVAPEVVTELLDQENITLGGERRDITVYFADVRGFTEFTDNAAAAAAEYVKRKGLTPEQAEKYFDQQAKETMDTVNLYLGIISDQITAHKGTLDKYIGDCVMAFWSAPLPEPKHALCAVRAALDSQRAMYACNQERAKENERRKVENAACEARGEDPLPLLPLLSLGSGINSGVCIVGMMGSEKHTKSYTVFGREVNLASRLEGVSGRGRIIISYRTYEDLQKFDPELAATCVELESVKVKGIRDAVRIFEVPWKLPETAAPAPATPVAAAVPTPAPAKTEAPAATVAQSATTPSLKPQA